MKKFDYSVVKDRKTYSILMPLGKFLRWLLYKVTYSGLENIPAEGGFILASNHITALDPFFLATGSPLPIHFMGKDEVFQKPVLRTLMTHFNGFPVSRGAADKTAVEYAIKLLARGGVLGIFPEGTRSKDNKIGQGKSGVALIAKAANADILPVAVYTPGKFKFRAKLTVRFGEMIRYEELGMSDDERSARELREAARVVMDRISQLWDECAG